MHAMQMNHMKLKDQIKRLQIKAGEIEVEAIRLGLAERHPTTVEEFRWPKGDVLARWGQDVWEAYKRERIEERFKWK